VPSREEEDLYAHREKGSIELRGRGGGRGPKKIIPYIGKGDYWGLHEKEEAANEKAIPAKAQ